MGHRLTEVTLSAFVLLFSSACGDSGPGDTNDNNDNQNNTSSLLCGDGEIQGLEECDDGSENSDTEPDACRSDCSLPHCGDGVVDENEACDDGASNSDAVPDACRSDCNEPRCGDGIVDVVAGELCDEGAALPTQTCSDACVVIYCGNGIVEEGETCDDGNFASQDGCSPDCLSNETCGNGYVDAALNEQCDDSGESALCNADCTVARCGDGQINSTAGETCDEGGETATCNVDCRAAACGDGVVNLAASEECDDGNLASRDGCSSGCTVEYLEWHRIPKLLDVRVGHMMTWDVTRQRVILFGGADSAVTQNDTWEFDGTDWQRVYTTTSPPPRGSGRLVHDSARGVTVLFGGLGDNGYLNDTWEFDGTDWTETSPATSPDPRYEHAMAFDAARGETVMFGGAIGYNSFFAETWVYDGTSWTQAAGGLPDWVSGRMSSAMAYDAANSRVVLYGGIGDNGWVDRGDTHVWNGTAWSLLTTAGPTRRRDGQMVYDVQRAKPVLFGGTVNNSGTYTLGNDLWELTGATWSQITPTGSAPDGRARFGMAWDGNNQHVLLHGGRTTDGGNSELWALSGSTWTEQHVFTPPFQGIHGFAYDPVRRLTVLHLGTFTNAGGQYKDHTWEFDGERWTNVITSSVPPARTRFDMVYDAARQVMVIHGGENRNDTWEYDGIDWTQRTFTGSVPPVAQTLIETNLVYDSARQVTVLYHRLTGTWEYDGTSWTQVLTTGLPTARQYTDMAYDVARQRVVLYGGMVYDGAAGRYYGSDTWEYDGTSWTEIITPTLPAGRCYHNLAYDSLRQRVVMFGGYLNAGIGTNDTWEYDGTDWTQIPTNVSPESVTNGPMSYDPIWKRILRHKKDVYELSYLSTWPDEICNAGIDEDLDGLTGCLDPDCEGKPCAGGGTCTGGTCQ